MKKSNKIILTVIIILLMAMLVISGITLWNRHQQSKPVTADVSWYDESGEEFIITTVEQLYGFAQLSENYDFNNQTVKLGTDIVVNRGDAEDWRSNVPGRRWTPITGFFGTFDGQGYTISGIYGDSVVTSLGLFTDTKADCVIKDLKLVNSYFKNNTDKGTGSIIGIGGGTLESIYSDAIISSAGRYVGGLIGRVTEKGQNLISNCWFDGTITMNGADTYDVGGLVGAFNVSDAINTVEHCHSTADIACKGDRNGGIFGNVGNGSFVNLTDSMFNDSVVRIKVALKNMRSYRTLICR
ncbi:MAG: hypothetical protein IJZ53_01905 [Tyzzerella sp.]|nr:hypothetical protein [Tyzzerella sp.]